MWTITHKPRAKRASGTMRRSLPVGDEIAKIKAEHHISETAAYAVLIRTSLAAPAERATPAKPTTDA